MDKTSIEELAKETNLYKDNSHSPVLQKAIMLAFRDGYMFHAKESENKLNAYRDQNDFMKMVLKDLAASLSKFKEFEMSKEKQWIETAIQYEIIDKHE